MIVEGRYVADMTHPVPIEPHAVIAQWEGEKVTVWSTDPDAVPGPRTASPQTLEMAESRVRIVVPHLGGGFGGKCEFHFEAHIAALSRAAGRPVRLVFDRRRGVRRPPTWPVTDVVATSGPASGATARSSPTRRRLVLDTGAYATHGPVITEIATMMAAGPYRMPNLLVEGRTAYTNRTPAGSTRAPSGPQVCWAIEQHMDALASRLGMDPLAFRLRNIAEEGDLGPSGQTLREDRRAGEPRGGGPPHRLGCARCRRGEGKGLRASAGGAARRARPAPTSSSTPTAAPRS